METAFAAEDTAPREESVFSAAVFAALVCLPAVICFARGAVDEPDVWWHIRTGQWILDCRAWPTTDSFSSWGAGSPWTAYSWLPEVLLAGLYQGLGLRGLVVYTAALSAAIVAALLAMLRRLEAGTMAVVALTLAGTLGLVLVEMPRPWLFSVLFCVIELDLLLTAGRTGNRRLLLWLVPLFALWANVHIQFVLGLAVLGAAAVEPVLARILPAALVSDDSCRISLAWMMLVFFLCVVATLLNPYGYHLYEAALALLGQSKLWNVIQELRAMPFRSMADWTVLGVAVSAAFALGWRRRVRLLLALLLIAGAWISFRSRRDAWFVLVVGLAVLAYVMPKAAAARESAPRCLRWAVGLAAVAVVILGGWLLDEAKLEEEVAASFPAEAVRFIHAHHCAGPMFNPFTWGGYLIDQLPEIPVNIDGRTMVHGQARVLRHAETLRVAPGWRDDPELAQARLVLLPCDSALAALLRSDGRFQVIHDDSVATVFSARPYEIAQDNHE